MSEYIKMNDAPIYNYQKDIIEEKDKEIEQLHSIIKEVREILKKHTTKFKDIYIPASEGWYLLEKVGVDKE